MATNIVNKLKDKVTQLSNKINEVANKQNTGSTYVSNNVGTGNTTKREDLLRGRNQVQTGNTTFEQDLNRLKELQQESQVARLEQQKRQTLRSLAEQEAEIKPKYEQQRNLASATSQQNARSFAEYLANRGLTNSGASAQGEINRLSTLQNTLGTLGRQEQAEYDSIARARQNAQQNYIDNLAIANSEIEANYFNQLLQENQRQRLIEEQLRQQSAQQYADDYQAQINTLLAQGYDPNSREILQLQALRGQKINETYNARQNALYQNAPTYLQAGITSPLIDKATGLGTTENQQLADFYNTQRLDDEKQRKLNLVAQFMNTGIIDANTIASQLNANGISTTSETVQPYIDYINASRKLETEGQELDNKLKAADIANTYSTISNRSSGGGGDGGNNTTFYKNLRTSLQNTLKDINSFDANGDKLYNAQQRQTKRDNASTIIVDNMGYLDEAELKSLTSEVGINKETIAKAMAKKDYDDASISSIMEVLEGGKLPSDYKKRLWAEYVTPYRNIG